MKRRSVNRRWSVVFVGCVLTLLPALVVAQTAAKKPQDKVSVIDMGTYKVSAPDKGWKAEVDKATGVVSFSKAKTGLLSFYTMSQRAEGITVQSQMLNIYGWRVSEEEAIERSLTEAAQRAFPPGANFEKETVEWDGKKLYSIKNAQRSAAINTDQVIFIYPLPDMSKSHTFFVFEYAYVRRGTQYIKLFKDPGMEQVRAVIKSLEIVDQLKGLPGVHGDLVRAAAAGDTDGVLKAIEAGADINGPEPGPSALSAAAFYGRREVVDLLLDKGAQVDAMNAKSGTPPLVAAIAGREPEIALLLVGKGADVKQTVSVGGGTDVTPLMLAVAIGQLDLARGIIDAGADIEAKTGLGETALVLASDNGWTEGMAMLLEKGADANTRMNDGTSAPMRAADKGHADAIKLLLEHKVDPDLKVTNGNWSGRTALMFAVSAGYADVAKVLIDNHADVNAQMDGNGDACLHGTCYLGRADIAKMLIEGGANVNLKTKEGLTPLMVAAEQGRNDIAKLLIDSGADVNAKNNKNQTALAIARKNKRGYIVSVLTSAGAK